MLTAQTDRSDPLQINVLIHIPCVPTILFTALVLVHYFDWASYSLLDIALGGDLVLNVTFPLLVVAAYATYFVLLEPLAGVSLRLSEWKGLGPALAVLQEPGVHCSPIGGVQSYRTDADTLPHVQQILYAPILLALGHFSNVLYATEPHAVKYAGYVFVVAWIAQFVGHGKVRNVRRKGYSFTEDASLPPPFAFPVLDSSSLKVALLPS